MKLPRLLALCAIFLFVADIPPPPPNGGGKPSASGGCKKASTALYHAQPRTMARAVQ